MYIEYCLWAQVAVLDIYIYILHILDCLGQDMQVLYLGRAPRTKETLPDFLKWRRVTRPPLVFRGLTGSQRTPGFWGVTLGLRALPLTHPLVYVARLRICRCLCSTLRLILVPLARTRGWRNKLCLFLSH